MSIRLKYSLCAILLMTSTAASAEMVQSTTSVYVSLRHCTSGETVCDSIERSAQRKIGGVPGGQKAEGELADEEFGTSSASAHLTGVPGSTILTAQATSLAGKRNGGTAFTIQRYANDSDQTQNLTFDVSIEYRQEVPEENSSFPAGQGVDSTPNFEMFVFSMDPEFIDVGSTPEENWALFEAEPPGLEELGSYIDKGLFGLVSDQGTIQKTSIISLSVGAGESIWWHSIIQALAANGAEVSVTAKTSMTVEPSE